MSMLWVAVGGTMALTAGAAIEGNKAIAKTASANARATSALLGQQYDVQKEGLLAAADQVNQNTGNQLSELVFQAMGASGATSTASTEKNLTGATASRLQNNVAMKKALQADQIMAQAEASMLDVNNQLRTAKYNYESGQMQNTISFNNMMSQQQSTLQIASSTASSGLGAYSMGKSAGLGA